jgi:uncharacterized membrane protein
MLVTPSLFVSDRSAAGVIVSVSVALLFAALAVVGVADRRGVDERARRRSGQRARCAEAQRAAAAGDRVRRRRDVAGAARAWHAPPLDAEQVHAQPVNVAGNVSATDTLLTATAAGLVTTIV